MATAWTGKCFIKKVPASGVAPCYKLTLPQQIVHKHLAHLVGQEFELASSSQAQHLTWPATIAPRRNKERSEYTLKGWKLFAEAHVVQLGDHVSFELVNPTRLVVKVISKNNSGPLARGSPTRSCRSPSAPSSPSHSPKRPLFCSPDHHEHSMPEQPSLPIDPDASSQDLLWSKAPFADWWQAASKELPSFPDAVGGNSTSEDSCCHLDPDQHLGLAGQVFASNVQQTPQATPGTPNSQQAHGNVPSLPPPLRVHGFRGQGGSHASLFTPPTASSTTFFDQLVDACGGPSGGSLPAGSCVDRQALVNRSATHDGISDFDMRSGGVTPLDQQLCNLDSTVRDLQLDVKRFENRAFQAEQEEARLRAFLGSARTKLETGLQAVAGLERVAGRLANSDLLASAPQSTDKLIATQQEMCQFIDSLKSGIWHILSTDA